MFRDDIRGPQVKIPNTRMVFQTLKSDQEIDDIIAFLKKSDADGKKKQPDRHAIAAAATARLRRGVD